MKSVGNIAGGAVPSDELVLFGITGDLACNKIFPALYAMAMRGFLNAPVVGVAPSRLSSAQLRKRARGAIGVTYPWTLLLSIAIGVWLTFTRLTFDSAGAMANSDHMVSLLVLTFTIIALAEVGRATRFINIPFGIWLIAAPWLLDGIASPLAVWNGVISGVLLIGLAIPRGPVRNSYGGWDRYVV